VEHEIVEEDPDRAEAKFRLEEARYEARAAKDAERTVAQLYVAEAHDARLAAQASDVQAAQQWDAEEAHEETQRILKVEAEKKFKAEDKDRRKLVAKEIKAERSDQRKAARARRREMKEALKAQAAWAAAQLDHTALVGAGGAEEASRKAEKAAEAGSRRRKSSTGSTPAVARAKELLLQADAAFFDVDSTVVKTEGIDLLGKCFGVMEEIAELTHKAMNGNVRFQDAMAQRLELMAEHGMDKDSLEECVLREGRPRWSHGVREVVKLLHDRGTDVYLVSGGFKNMLYPIAEKLEIPRENVYANEILFDKAGKYSGFDRKNPTSASGGKPKVLKMMKRKHGYKTMVMFGDGATDMDARTAGAADAFIGYGGVVDREKIREGADWFVYSFREVVSVLKEKD